MELMIVLGLTAMYWVQARFALQGGMGGMVSCLVSNSCALITLTHLLHLSCTLWHFVEFKACGGRQLTPAVVLLHVHVRIVTGLLLQRPSGPLGGCCYWMTWMFSGLHYQL